VTVEGRPREIAGGAKIAAVLITIAPWLAALVGAGQTLVLMRGLESSPLERLAYWGLVAMALACAFFISRHLWRGVHDGGIAPVRLLLLSTLPLWLLSEAVGQFLAQYRLQRAVTKMPRPRPPMRSPARGAWPGSDCRSLRCPCSVSRCDCGNGHAPRAGE
jgi:hypothetical protein